MKRKLTVAGIIVAVVFSLGSFLLYHFMTGPMYESGQVRSSTALDPPEQPEGATWFQVTPDVRLHTFERGTGRPILVVHGGPGFPPSQPYSGLDRIGNARFVYYDQRGSGRSTRPFDRITDGMFAGMKKLESALGLGQQVADIERIRRILGQEKLVLLGHSFGAFLASLYAAEFPERVAALILVAPASLVKMPGDHPDLFESMRARLPEARRAAFDSWLERYLDMGGVFDRSEAELAALGREIGPFWAESLAAGGTTVPPEVTIEGNGGWMVYAMFFSMGMRHDYSPHLGAVTAPVLVVHGEKDLQPEATSREYVGYFPNAQFVAIPDAAHFPFIENPEAFANAAEPFLARL